MQDLKVTLIQSDLYWQDRHKNLGAFEKKIAQIDEQTDLVLLPEMFTTGFTMNSAAYAEEMDGPTMKWMATQADKVEAVIIGSLIIKEGQRYFNRLIWMFPGGMFHTYDKRHLFAMAGEHQHYTQGEERLLVEYKGWKVCPMICYDLRFPVWARNQDDYDLLIYIANWPNKRSYDWRTLLKARAIENQAYVVAVNRVGKDDNGHDYDGDSCVIDPGWKKELYRSKKDEVVHTTTLSVTHLQDVRKKLPFLVDRDDFKLL